MKFDECSHQLPVPCSRVVHMGRRREIGIAGYITKPICLEEHWVMPEEPELDLDKLHEAIHEEVEHEGGWMLKAIALTTALFAAFAAVAALQAGGTVNEAL